MAIIDDEEELIILLKSVLKIISFTRITIISIIVIFTVLLAWSIPKCFGFLCRLFCRVKSKKHLSGTKYIAKETEYGGCKRIIYIPTNVQWNNIHCKKGFIFRSSENRIVFYERLITFFIWLFGICFILIYYLLVVVLEY